MSVEELYVAVPLRRLVLGLVADCCCRPLVMVQMRRVPVKVPLELKGETMIVDSLV